MLKKTAILILSFTISSLSLNGQETLLWKFQTGDRIYSTPLVTGHMTYVGSGDGNFYALENKSGQLKWKFETGGAIHSSPGVRNGHIYFSSDDGFLYALHARTGALAWKFESGGELSYDVWDYYRSSPVVAGGNVYWGSGDGNIYALDAGDGSLIWKHPTDDIVHASPVVIKNRVYIGGFDGIFYALDAANGEPIWEFNTLGAQFFPKGEVQKAALVEEEALYVGTRDYNLYALDVNTGAVRWNYREVQGWIIATPLSYEGKLYFGTSDAHMFYCMDKASGAILWNIHVPMRVYGSAIEHKGLIYFGCFDGKVFGVDPASGETRWEYQTLASRTNYSQIFKPDGSFNDDFVLYGANYLDSERKIHTLGSVLSTPVIQDDVIYFGSSDGNLYAVKLP